MDFKQLEAFTHVVRLGSFSRAAEALFLTQPTVSAHIATLERELGTSLIVRGGKTAQPTDVGRTLYDYALHILTLRDQALAACKDGGGLKGIVRIAASTVTYQYVLPQLMSTFRQRHGAVTFDIKRCDSEGVVEAIVAGQAEIGMTGTATADGSCIFREFMEDNLVVITPITPPYDAMEDFTLDALRQHPFILREAGSGTRRETERYLERQGVTLLSLQVAAYMEEPDAIKNAVRQGLGISIVSRLAVQDYEDMGYIRVVPLEGQAIHRKLFIVRHKRRPLGPAADAFLDFVLATQ